MSVPSHPAVLTDDAGNDLIILGGGKMRGPTEI